MKTVARLRGPGGCPWDREQTHQSLRKFLIEEAYEVLDVLDQIPDEKELTSPTISSSFKEEWGDLLLQILLHAEIATETNPELSIEAIARTLNEKLIRRHPHVFGEVAVSGSAEVLKNWDQIKKQEKGETNGLTSVFDSIPRSLPPLLRTDKVISKVTKVGFQWPDLNGPIGKLEEEVRELRRELEDQAPLNDSRRAKIEAELGDVLFCVCNIAHLTKIDPESALRQTLRKFESRFRHVETRLHESGTSPEKVSLAEMDRYWDEAKAIERKDA
ncbi:MAG: nucleoside triphosphate pyrophosphohydrolase [Bdellovibrionales bacterium]|nr:nucleoside triphosphate pyrophosphohydrolase [Bdellovibrionales bacterium]